ncbi:unnamed protein product [Microthlaspi erraticum]|uniref:DUF659 domain-containing protein n=1 Tax=Microthlaspi erraticum TaxID=1685480 RepID=A0A6D2IFP1_9BRAS|nr:unnamed protein product [Microthlaspi erraticum]
MVDYNRRGQLIKDSGGLLGSWLGSLSCDLNILPINYTDWRKVPAYRKDMAWKVIQKKFWFDNPIKRRKYVISTLGARCKDLKRRLWKKYRRNTHFGHEHSGRVRFIGHGPTPSKYFSSLDSTSVNMEMVEFKLLVKSFVGKVDIVASALQVLIESRCKFQVSETDENKLDILKQAQNISKTIVNLCINSRGGTCFLSSKDASKDAHTGEYIFQYIDKCIEEIGADKVVQAVIDNATNNVSATRLLRQKRPNIFWSSCAAHTVDLMLEGISKLPG